MSQIDVIIVGGGIVGLATAYALWQRFPGKRVLVLEKEEQVVRHQTGHNSGVIHSGIYYKPKSSKALNCRRGKKLLEKFCADHNVPFRICGKVIVATSDKELPSLQNLFERGNANGVDCEWISRDRLREIEPHCGGIQAIHVRETGIVDYRAVGEELRKLIVLEGHEVRTGVRVESIQETSQGVIVRSTSEEFQSAFVINCAGLYCDQVARAAGQRVDTHIVPFRGEYYALKPEAKRYCNTLIYPVPDPRFPFLGVHFTSMIGGGVECGPNAVLALAREGYSWSEVNFEEFLETLRFSGFRRMASKYWRAGMEEMWRSIWKPAFVKALQRLVPEIRSQDLVSAPAGVRAQAVTAEGGLLDDFAFVESARIISVINAPSPAATASLSIGAEVADRLNHRFT